MHAIVKEHLEYFKNCYSKSSDKQSGITGFGNCSARTAFDEVSNQSNDYFIPACLLFIYFGKGGISKNKDFALKILKSIHLNPSGDINDNIVAYVYAYCLQKEGRTKESHEILKLLKEEEFAPAFMTYGDFLIKNGDFDKGLDQYWKAIRLDSEFAKVRLYFFKYGKLPFLGKLIRLFLGLKPTFRMLKLGALGAKCLYLDFYNVSNWFKRQ